MKKDTSLTLRIAGISAILLLMPLMNAYPANASSKQGFSAPGAVAFDSKNGDIYVTNFVSNTISVIDGTTNTIIKTIN